ncbi:MAG: septum formation initiator family protein [Armatimonadota bacterium]|nr:septum formation initiator family protein [Armatimonadota bacterium]MDR7426734.1 septum formation initiator family protein [Armatimonadota bacterium]MDR7464408.1 septum formation initiator family protein [Armatimonadota bacterium]MDR7475095.1 septum formation initiator family protein [Armatimonadota bacterium]MDR7540289.1 septum formation initiator family protein [Armatimonadota bacterium]
MPKDYLPHRTLTHPGLRRRFPRWVIPLLVLAAATLLLRAYGASTLTAYRLRREAARLEGQIQTLRRENAQLREEIRRLHTPAYIERLAREQLGLVRPGEIPVILIRTTPTPPPAP